MLYLTILNATDINATILNATDPSQVDMRTTKVKRKETRGMFADFRQLRP